MLWRNDEGASRPRPRFDIRFNENKIIDLDTTASINVDYVSGCTDNPLDDHQAELI